MTRLLDRYCQLLKILLTLLMMLMILPVSIQMISRYTGTSYIWTEEVARFCFVWIIMIGSMIAVREGTHFDVDLMPAAKTKREQGVSKLIVHGAMSLMAVAFIWYGVEFARFGWIQSSEISGINMLSIHISFPLAGVSWLVFLSEKIREDVELIRSAPAEAAE